ncbi:MAG: diaminopimelate epimerase [candidate division WOR-3 bacterium]
MNEFVKSHGLGNDYIIFEKEKTNFTLNEKNIRLICDRNYGVGSDGILLLEKINNKEFKVRIFNPDGSEAEKSGNGIRILAKYIYDYGYTTEKEFYIHTLGGTVKASIIEEHNKRAKKIEVEMGKVSFKSSQIPVLGPEREVIDEEIEIDGEKIKVTCLSIGNPHCVFFVEEIDENKIRKLGPILENYTLFPNRTNVQMVKIINPEKIEIRIWERGAGYTLASGSSSCAAAAASYKKGLVKNEIEVKMPGGDLFIKINPDWTVNLVGPVEEVYKGKLSEEFLYKLQD